jgi:hypothetical protein
MKEKGERGNRDRALGKRRKVGGVWAKSPFFLLPIQNRGGAGAERRPVSGRGRRRSRPWRRRGIGLKWRGGQGGSIPVLTLR